MWDTEIVRQSSPAVECQITDIHSVARHQWLVQAVEHLTSKLKSSVAVLFATAVQIQWGPLILHTDLLGGGGGGGDHSSVLIISVPELYLYKHGYKM